jgi:twitching motility protein PilT
VSIEDVFIFASQQGCSDIHVRSGASPVVRKDGKLLPVQGVPKTSADELRLFLERYLTDRHRETLRESLNVDFPVSLQGIGRYRVNAFYAKGRQSMAVRIINAEIPDFAALGLPKVIERISLLTRGLVLVTGTTGSGKSTSLAAMIQYVNERQAKHILTIEDPIEFIFDDKRSIINQREIGVDASSFSDAIRAAMREDPDSILVGEMRDRETIEAALTAAETGHLVLSTLHTADAKELVNRVVIAFPPHQQKEIRYQIASTLKAVVSQRLVPCAKGGGRVPACEILIVTSLVKEILMDEDRLHELPDAMEKGYEAYGMQTFDRALLDLHRSGQITMETALENATNRADLKLRIDGIHNR